jgi:CRISPR-associated protein Csd1
MMRIGDITIVFWSAKQNNFENTLPFLFSFPKDNPDAGTNAVNALLESVENGALDNDDNKTEFYVLGLSPNAARISVRFFIKDTVKGMSRNIAQHFKDLKIDKPSFENEFLPLFRLLVSTATLGKSENIAPHLAGDFMMSVLQGLPYPATLLQAVINRIKAEQEINYPRAALIKAYLTRLTGHNKPKEEIKVSLNKENTDQGYVLGRLFATLEKLQEDAQGTTNSTIMRFYGSASSTPVAVFANLMRLHHHHLNKLSKEKPGMAVNYEKLIGEIQNKIMIINSGAIAYPTHLSLGQQGLFAVGYYQQRQDFFKTKEEKAEIENQSKGEQENG